MRPLASLLLVLVIGAGPLTLPAQPVMSDDARNSPTRGTRYDMDPDAMAGDQGSDATDPRLSDEEREQSRQVRELGAHDAPTPTRAEARDAGESIRKHLSEAVTAFEANDAEAAANHLTEAAVLLRNLAGRMDRHVPRMRRGGPDRPGAQPGLVTGAVPGAPGILPAGQPVPREDRPTTGDMAPPADGGMDEARERIEAELTDSQRNLRDSIRRVEELATRIEKNEVDNADDLRSVISDLHRSLAEYHYDVAHRILSRVDRAAWRGPGMRRSAETQGLLTPAETDRMEAEEDETVLTQEDAAEPEELDADALAADQATTATLNRRQRAALALNLAESAASFRAWSELNQKDFDDETEQVVATIENWGVKVREGSDWRAAELRQALDTFGARLDDHGFTVRNAYGIRDPRPVTGGGEGSLPAERPRDRRDGRDEAKNDRPQSGVPAMDPEPNAATD